MVNKKLEEMLLQITPGTPLREGLYNIIDAGIGALIVVGMDESVEKMLDGGFYTKKNEYCNDQNYNDICHD